MSKPYSSLNGRVTHHKGKLVKQYNLVFNNSKTNERAILKVRFSPVWQDIIEFELETDSIPVADQHGKDITINWKMLGSFNPNGTFYTDSNGLEMQTRQFKKW